MAYFFIQLVGESFGCRTGGFVVADLNGYGEGFKATHPRGLCYEADLEDRAFDGHSLNGVPSEVGRRLKQIFSIAGAHSRDVYPVSCQQLAVVLARTIEYLDILLVRAAEAAVNQSNVGLFSIRNSECIQIRAKHDLGLGNDRISVLVKSKFINTDMRVGYRFGFSILTAVVITFFSNHHTVLTGGGAVCQLSGRIVELVAAKGSNNFGLLCGAAIIGTAVNAYTVFGTGRRGTLLRNVLPAMGIRREGYLLRMIAAAARAGENHSGASHTGRFSSCSRVIGMTERIGNIVELALTATLTVIFGVSLLITGRSSGLRVVVMTVELASIGRGSKSGQIRREVSGIKDYEAAVLGFIVGCRIIAQLTLVIDVPYRNAIGVGICRERIRKSNGDTSITELGNGDTALRECKIINRRILRKLVADSFWKRAYIHGIRNDGYLLSGIICKQIQRSLVELEGNSAQNHLVAFQKRLVHGLRRIGKHHSGFGMAAAVQTGVGSYAAIGHAVVPTVSIGIYLNGDGRLVRCRTTCASVCLASLCFTCGILRNGCYVAVTGDLNRFRSRLRTSETESRIDLVICTGSSRF